jgi:hypothetical protein
MRQTITQTNGRYPRAPLESDAVAEQLVTMINEHAEALDGIHFDVTVYGATGDGTTDDRAAIQSAIDAANEAGGVVYFPNGTYLVDADGVNAWCLRLRSNIVLQGQSRNGVIIKRKVGLGTTIRPVSAPDTGATITDIIIRNLTIDGNQFDGTLGTFQEHAANIFLTRTSRVYICDVTSKNAGGDGVDIHDSNTGDTQDITIERCLLTNNGRYGIVLNGGGQQRVYVRDCIAADNYGDGLHLELSGNGITDLVVQANYFSRTNTVDDYGVGLRGLSDVNQSSRIYFVNNRVKGSVLVNFCNSVLLAGNTVVTDSNLPAITIYQATTDIVVRDNFLTNSAGNTSDAVVLVQGSNPAGQPDRITIQGNNIYALHDIDGIKAQNALSIAVLNNLIRGTATNDFYGLQVLASDLAMTTVVASNNHFIDFKRAIVVGGDNAIESLVAVGNVIEKVDNADATGGMDLDYDGNDALLKATVIGNSLAGFTGAMFSQLTVGDGYPACPVLIGGNDPERGIWSCTGTPEGAITASIGAQALRRDGGASTTLYVKTSGAGNTGWTAK